jgi:hypothetical protein
MFINSDKWGGIKISDMSFMGVAAANSSFMQSVSNGGAQNYMFETLTFSNFNKVLDLQGTNTNSEFTFTHVNFNGIIRDALYVGSAAGSDQFLNYSFFGCNFEVSEGNFVSMAKGGNVSVWGGSFIHYGSNAGTFFKLLGNTHARGVQRLLVEGARFEHRNMPASKLMEMEWAGGSVAFNNIDQSSSEDGTGDGHVRVVVRNVNVASPIIEFANSSIAGMHEYQFDANSWQGLKSVVYRNCDLHAIRDATDTIANFITTTNTSATGNTAGKFPIKFENCRPIRQGTAWALPINTVFNGMSANGVVTGKKIIPVLNVDGILPFNGGTLTFDLPIGSIITEVRAVLPAGATGYTTTGLAYTLKTSQNTPTTIATMTLSQLDLGFNLTQTPWYVCDTQDKAKIVVTSPTGTTPDQINKIALYVEYM